MNTYPSREGYLKIDYVSEIFTNGLGTNKKK